MTTKPKAITPQLPPGVMLNAYPDSIGSRLADTIALLERPELEDAFSLFYVLPTFFHSDLDRGFSVIDYDLNEALVTRADLEALDRLGIQVKLDLVLNHLSVRSPQFQDLLRHGEASDYRDFFIDWDEFWREHGEVSTDGQVIPHREHLDKLFMRKPTLPVLRLQFPDGKVKTYWNTFYQKIEFGEITADDFADIDGLDPDGAAALVDHIRVVIEDKGTIGEEDLGHVGHLKDEIMATILRKREYLGQMDLNARSESVWRFYDETLRKLRDYGAKVIRLDAFAYLHKEPGEPNFFNRPGTWHYLRRLKNIAANYGLTVFPEIHAEYGAGIHEEIAGEGYPIYDFFFPGLVIDALDRGDAMPLRRWIDEIQRKGLQTINMLGCHDGIPVLDLRGKRVDGSYRPGLLPDEHVDAAVERIMARGGLTKNLYGADGRKIDYYQINATFFSALGEEDQRLRLARAIQMFMPGVPQVWYLDLFAGSNDYDAVNRGHTAGHKEINRTNLSLDDIDRRLQQPVVRDQIDLIRLRNTSPAFRGELRLVDAAPHRLHLAWKNGNAEAELEADLATLDFRVRHVDAAGQETIRDYPA
jgi:sucrose phosphorylase